MANKPGLLIIDDDESIGLQMKWALRDEYDVSLATDSKTALKIIKNKMSPVVTLDLGLPPDPEGTGEGFKLLESIMQYSPATKVIVVSGNPDEEAPLEAISKGAHDFFIKPIDMDELKFVLNRSYYVYTLENEYKSLKSRFRSEPFGEMIGSSRTMQEVFDTVRKVSTTDIPVLITGESGTGKELVAKAIHRNGIRCSDPFIPINCGAIPENLMESELFGHEKGAFTGAHIRRQGKIEMANGGTLFLDEIGDLALPLQVKLLRFLQDQTLERVGGRETFKLDVRIIAATNKNVEWLVKEGRFREDLYYRLAVVTIELPPLRDRGEDLLILSRHFLQKYNAGNGRAKSLSMKAIKTMQVYEWPGNIRELENKIQRAVAFTEGSVISATEMGLADTRTEERNLNLKRAREQLDVEYINLALAKNSGNISRAADDLGLTRPTLHGLIKKYNIEK